MEDSGILTSVMAVIESVAAVNTRTPCADCSVKLRLLISTSAADAAELVTYVTVSAGMPMLAAVTLITASWLLRSNAVPTTPLMFRDERKVTRGEDCVVGLLVGMALGASVVGCMVVVVVGLNVKNGVGGWDSFFPDDIFK